MTDTPDRHDPPTLLERAEGAEKLFLSGRRHREADLASAVRFFLEFLEAFERFETTQPCVTVFGSSRYTEDLGIQWGGKFTADAAHGNATGYGFPNSIGLKGRCFRVERINHLLDMYRTLYNKGMNTSQAIEYIEEEMPATDERDEIVTFVRESGRGIIKRFTKGNHDDDIPV